MVHSLKKHEKEILFSFVTSVSPPIHTSVHTEQLDSHPTAFHVSLGLESLIKSVTKIQVWLKLQLDKKKQHEKLHTFFIIPISNTTTHASVNKITNVCIVSVTFDTMLPWSIKSSLTF